MARSKKPAASVPVDAHKHVADKRPNIPTRETAAFAADDGPQPFVVHRDRSLDPQLVWKGKDDQDAQPRLVPAVPLHVQEKIHPRAIVEKVKEWMVKEWMVDREGHPPSTFHPSLFDDFNGLDDFAKKLEFYQHDQHWTNRLILGDSLLVMASLAEKERLRGQVQCVYFDPPYGIKFGSNWQVSTRKRDVKDAKAEDLTRQPEQIKAFRDTWELGIHSYLSYLRDRLAAARDLLTESGSIFVQIGDENVHHLREIVEEVFGRENYVALVVVKKTGGLGTEGIKSVADYLIWYAKDKEHLKYRPLFSMKELGKGETTGERYDQLLSPDGAEQRSMTPEERENPSLVPPGWRAYQLDNLTSGAFRENTTVPFTFRGEVFHPGPNACWKTTTVGLGRLASLGRIQKAGKTLRYVRFLEDFPCTEITNVWSDVAGAADKVYVVQTSPTVIQRCILMTTDPGDLVLDPTCGSGTTAYVAEQWGRRWITIDTSRVALALARTRLMAARFPYYLLADSPAGRKKQREIEGFTAEGAESAEKSENRSELKTQVSSSAPSAPSAVNPSSAPDLHRGFVYRTVPHVTLKSIANNPDIQEGMTREQIDAAIARHADTETLYDQPYEDKTIVRLTGPFTVESLSPHRRLPEGFTAEGAEGAEKRGKSSEFKTQGSSSAPSAPSAVNFLSMILENLRKTGVKGTDKKQRITFARLDTFPGEYVHAEGETDKGVAVRVCVGPEFGTLGDADIKKAALEAVKGSKCDLLLVCAFAFEASVHQQTAELTKEIKLGKLAVLPVRMNPDLEMGDELLKKTGTGNLFTVFGEPDVVVACEEWMVDNRGRRIIPHERLTRLSGLGSLEEINRVGGEDPSFFKELSARGGIRHDLPDTKGSRVRGGKHRGRGGKEQHGGVRAVPGDRSGISGGGGDADRAGSGVRLPDVGPERTAAGRSSGDSQDALRPDEIAALQALTPAALPLSTIHLTHVTIRGVDVFDPSTGAVRTGDTDDIACWFIDTDYDGQSFFVRHAYFLYGGKDSKEGPYEKLKKALRAEIDEGEWSKLYSATSQSFDPPQSGKIAVKVINHFGDEVLKVYQVPALAGASG